LPWKSHEMAAIPHSLALQTGPEKVCCAMLLRPIGQVEASLVLLGGCLDARRPGQSQRLVKTECLRNIRSTDFCKTRRGTAPSSMACAAPCAQNGSIAWQASPSKVTRPADQCSIGGCSKSPQTNASSTASTIERTCGCHPSNASSTSATSAGWVVADLWGLIWSVVRASYSFLILVAPSGPISTRNPDASFCHPL